MRGLPSVGKWEMGKKTEGGTLASLGNHPLVILLTLLGNAFDRNNGREGYRRHRRHRRHRISLKGPHQIQLAWCSISATLRFSSSSWATVRGYFSFFFRQWERDGGLGKKEGRGTSPELPPIPRPPKPPRERQHTPYSAGRVVHHTPCSRYHPRYLL